MGREMYELKESAREDLRAEYDAMVADGSVDFDELRDRIHEIADGSVPVYNYQLLELAMSDLWLACEDTEFGATDAIGCISEAVYRAIDEDLHQFVYELEQEHEEMIVAEEDETYAEELEDMTDEDVQNEIDVLSGQVEHYTRIGLNAVAAMFNEDLVKALRERRRRGFGPARIYAA